MNRRADTRVAVFSDAHGNLEALDVMLDATRYMGVGMVISLGDLVDAKLPKDDDGTEKLPMSRLADHVETIAGRVSSCLLLRGNQEERVARRAHLDASTEQVRRIFLAPGERRLADFTFAHGHQFPWTNPLPERWQPIVPRDIAVLIHGHRHRRQVLRRPLSASAACQYEQLDIELGRSIAIRGEDQTLIDVGPLFVDGAWVLMDLARRDVTYYAASWS